MKWTENVICIVDCVWERERERPIFRARKTAKVCKGKISGKRVVKVCIEHTLTIQYNDSFCLKQFSWMSKFLYSRVFKIFRVYWVCWILLLETKKKTSDSTKITKAKRVMPIHLSFCGYVELITYIKYIRQFCNSSNINVPDLKMIQWVRIYCKNYCFWRR